jgi:hypothetical protein
VDIVDAGCLGSVDKNFGIAEVIGDPGVCGWSLVEETNIE